MSHRINPIGPHDRRITPVPRVERRERARDERDPEQEREEFEEQLERGLREQRQRQQPAAGRVDVSAGADVAPGREARSRDAWPAGRDRPDDGHPHIDVSV